MTEINKIHPLDLAELLAVESEFFIERADALEQGEDLGSITIDGKVYIQDALAPRSPEPHFIF